MFKQILAIDVAKRIPDFSKLVKSFSKNPVVLLENESLLDKSLIDAILVSIYHPLTVDFLSLFPELKYIGILGSSQKKIPVDFCQKKGIKISSVTDYCDNETSEWVMWQILSYFRKKNPPLSVCEKKLGVIGAGFVGKKLINLGRAFLMPVFYNSQRANNDIEGYLSKEQLFSNCDVISFHTPPECKWLSLDILLHAKKNLCLINTCMGRISHGHDLENFLLDRPDVTLIMDKIAGDNYQELRDRAHIIDELAFFTHDSEQRLIDKFFINLT